MICVPICHLRELTAVQLSLAEVPEAKLTHLLSALCVLLHKLDTKRPGELLSSLHEMTQLRVVG